MKKNIRNIILTTLVIFLSLFTFSCKEMTDSLMSGGNNSEPTQAGFHGTTKNEAKNYVGLVNDNYRPISNSRFINGGIIKDFRGSGKDVTFEGELIEYNDLINDYINKYVGMKDYIGKIKNKTAARHLSYEDFPYDPSKYYVEFSTFTDNEGNILQYDLVFFEQANEEEYRGKLGKLVSFNPDFTIDIGRSKNIITGETVIYDYKK